MSTAPTTTPGPIRDRLRTTARWRRFTPWQGPATRVDVALMGAILAVVALGLVLRPLEPFLLASHPVVLEFLTGDLTVIGAAAAFARIGEAPLWLVVLAGAVGMVKFDWLTWWIGRRWGGGIIRMLTASERARRFAARATELKPWILRVAVVLAVLPGVPTAVVCAVAGWAGMRLVTFLLLDLAGALLMTGLVAGLGYGLGQRAVDLVLLIDEYASVVTLVMITLAVVTPLIKRWLRRSRWARTPTDPAVISEPCVEGHDMDTRRCGAPCYRRDWRDSCAPAHHGRRRGQARRGVEFDDVRTWNVLRRQPPGTEARRVVPVRHGHPHPRPRAAGCWTPARGPGVARPVLGRRVRHPRRGGLRAAPRAGRPAAGRPHHGWTVAQRGSCGPAVGLSRRLSSAIGWARRPQW